MRPAYRKSARPLRPGARLVVCPGCAGLRRVRVYTGPLGGPPLLGDVLCESLRDCPRCSGEGQVEAPIERAGKTLLARGALWLWRRGVALALRLDAAERRLTGEPPRGRHV